MSLRSLPTPPSVPSRRSPTPAASAGRWWTAAVAGLFLFAVFSTVQAAGKDTPNVTLNLDQCRNGGWNDPPLDPCQWVNGNLNGNQAHYTEGESIAYRTTLTGVVPATEYTLRIGWDITKDFKHALDYLTGYDRIAEAVDPCAGISPCVYGGAYPIPLPAGSPQPQASFNALNASERFLAIYGGTLLSASYASHGDLLAAQSEATLDITFRATAATTVLAWGGHIASQADWGAGNSAIAIAGSPYHMRLKSFSAGNVGNQDRSLQDARAPPAEPQGGSLTVVKEVVNENSGAAVPADFTIHVLGPGGADVAGSPQPGDAIGTSYVALPPGDYRVTEDAAPGYILTYSGDCGPDGSVSLADGDLKTCILTNTDPPTYLTVVKQFVNDDGGSAGLGDVRLFIDGAEVQSGVATEVQPGLHQVSEQGPAGYAAFFAGDCDAGGNVSLALGESKVCLLTDDDIAPILTVRKAVVNDHGGTATAASFTLRVDGSPVGNGVPAAYAAGLHMVSEDAAAGYAGTLGGDCAADGSIVLAPGDEKECILTNDDVQPLLTVRKEVVNDDGGSFAAGDAQLFIDGFSAPQGEPVGLFAGTHTVSETPVPGYRRSFSGDCDADGTVLLQPGESKECVVRNDDIAPRLTVTKLVVNDDGGTLAPEDPLLFAGAIRVFSGQETELTAGPWTISESGAGPYLASFGGDCDANGTVLLAVGDVKACTLTNDDIQPRLTVTKVVVNDHGGTAQASDFALHVGEASVANGAEAGFDAGTYRVWEDGLPGYAASFAGDCDAGGNVSLAIGDVKSCTITNDDIQPRLTVTKVVVNDDGGSAGVADFPLFIDGQPVASGSETGLMAGLHTVSELGSPGYAASFAGDCDAEAASRSCRASPSRARSRTTTSARC